MPQQNRALFSIFRTQSLHSSLISSCNFVHSDATPIYFFSSFRTCQHYLFYLLYYLVFFTIFLSSSNFPIIHHFLHPKVTIACDKFRMCTNRKTLLPINSSLAANQGFAIKVLDVRAAAVDSTFLRKVSKHQLFLSLSLSYLCDCFLSSFFASRPFYPNDQICPESFISGFQIKRQSFTMCRPPHARSIRDPELSNEIFAHLIQWRTLLIAEVTEKPSVPRPRMLSPEESEDWLEHTYSPVTTPLFYLKYHHSPFSFPVPNP